MAGADEPVAVPPGDTLDLHCFAPRDVESVVSEFLAAARRAGLPEVRLIHGRGSGAQRARVLALLARTPWVASAREATPDRGGWGATVVTLEPAGVPDTGAGP